MSKEPTTRRMRRRTHKDATPHATIPCPICGDLLYSDTADLHAIAEVWVIQRIKKDHPEWVEANGACPKCLEFYLKL